MLYRHSIPTKYLRLPVLTLCLLLAGCEDGAVRKGAFDHATYQVTASKHAENVRSNVPEVLVPVAGGIDVCGTEELTVDYTNASEGYLFLRYTGDNPKVKLQLTGPDQVTYTYNLLTEESVIPIVSGNGNYTAFFYENINGNQYATLYATDLELRVTNEFGPYLYPNQYVNFTKDTGAVALAETLAEGAASDIEVISSVYSYIIGNIRYDEVKYQTADKTYLPDLDQILADQSGFCLDYASVMTAMLRSQRIPTRLEIGYAGDVYHAWISVNVDDQGWVNGMIEFNGQDWTLMDPTFAANVSKSDLKSFIGDGTNYTTKYVH